MLETTWSHDSAGLYKVAEKGKKYKDTGRLHQRYAMKYHLICRWYPTLLQGRQLHSNGLKWRLINQNLFKTTEVSNIFITLHYPVMGRRVKLFWEDLYSPLKTAGPYLEVLQTWIFRTGIPAVHIPLWIRLDGVCFFALHPKFSWDWQHSSNLSPNSHTLLHDNIYKQSN